MTAFTVETVGGVILSAVGDSGLVSSSVLVGGTTAAARNVIVSTGHDIEVLAGASDETVQGNYIGTNATATAAFPNIFGVWLDQSSNDTIGGTSAGDGNVIGGAVGSAGIDVLREFNNSIGADSTGNVIQGNWIGISPTGTALPNAGGITFQGTSNNTVGGTSAGAGNIIADNTGDGVDVGATYLSGGNDLTTASGDTIVDAIRFTIIRAAWASTCCKGQRRIRAASHRKRPALRHFRQQ